MLSTAKILFVCGSPNQTKMYHKIAKEINFAQCFFTYSYADGFLKLIKQTPILQRTVLGQKTLDWNLNYFKSHNLNIDIGGLKNDYDLFVCAQDVSIPFNLKNKKFILVQEGTVVPDNWLSTLVDKLKLPRYFANTTLVGKSNRFEKFCVASEGYRKIFLNKGVHASKLIVTGMPNFDYCAQLLDNDFPFQNYHLVATSCLRENYKHENRIAFLKQVKSIVGDEEVIFKLHPREKVARATKEIKRYFPKSKIFADGNTDHMIANCHTLFTKYSSVLLVAAALGKKIYSDLDDKLIKSLSPLQNGGTSASAIARVIRGVLVET